jgi:hypothetical protein
MNKVSSYGMLVIESGVRFPILSVSVDTILQKVAFFKKKSEFFIFTQISIIYIKIVLKIHISINDNFLIILGGFKMQCILQKSHL